MSNDGSVDRILERLNEDLMGKVIEWLSICKFCGVAGVHELYKFRSGFRIYEGYICDKCKSFPCSFENTREGIIKHFRIKESTVKGNFSTRRWMSWDLPMGSYTNVTVSNHVSVVGFIILHENMKHGYSDLKFKIRTINFKFDAELTFNVP